MIQKSLSDHIARYFLKNFSLRNYQLLRYESLEDKNTLKVMLFLFNLPNFKNCFYKIYPFLSIFLHGSDLQLSILSKLTPLKKPFVAKRKSEKKSKFKPKKNTT